MAMSKIDEDAAILEAATPGPWQHKTNGLGDWIETGDEDDPLYVCDGLTPGDAAFLVRAHNRLHLYIALARAVSAFYDSVMAHGIANSWAEYAAMIAALAALEE